MSSCFPHPPSPPQEHGSTSSRANHSVAEGNERLDEEPRHTGHRKGKTVGLRMTRTESSLPTPPRTRDTRRTSQSPAHALTSSPPCIPEDHPSRSSAPSSSSRLTLFAALSSFRRPTFASQLGAPTEEGGLIPPPQIHDAPENPFLSSLASSTSSSLAGPSSSSSNKRPRISSMKRQPSMILELPVEEQAEADIIRASPINATRHIDPSDPDVFTFSPPPPPTSNSQRKPRGRLLDFLGSTRHLARHATSPFTSSSSHIPSSPSTDKSSTLSAPPPHSVATTTPPATIRKTRRLPPPLTPGAQARLDKLSNPFLSGLGLAKAGKIAPPRVGKLEEKETIGYVFRGTKTIFANPFFRPKKNVAAVEGDSDADEVDGEKEEEDRSKLPVDHPDYSPVENPPPRLLFPVASGSSSSRELEDSSCGSDGEEEEEEHELGSGVRPRLLFPSAEDVENDSDDDDEVVVERKVVPVMSMMAMATTPRRGVKRASPEEVEEELTVFGTPRRGGKKMRL